MSSRWTLEMYPVIIEVSRQEDSLRFRNVNQPCKALPRITDGSFFIGDRYR